MTMLIDPALSQGVDLILFHVPGAEQSKAGKKDWYEFTGEE